jgi:hypothetical protein
MFFPAIIEILITKSNLIHVFNKID